MSTFKDNAGREWTPKVNVLAIAFARESAEVDIVDINQIEKLADPVTLTKVLFGCCETGEMTFADFSKGFDGDTLEVAGEILVQRIIEFFPKERREVLNQLMSRGKVVAAEKLEEVRKTLAADGLLTAQAS